MSDKGEIMNQVRFKALTLLPGKVYLVPVYSRSGEILLLLRGLEFLLRVRNF